MFNINKIEKNYWKKLLKNLIIILRSLSYTTKYTILFLREKIQYFNFLLSVSNLFF